jgi:glycosyltransferase involved in cell wall biosynthesis
MGPNSDGRRVRVSIGLPVYNGERFLRNSLDSILAQTFTDFELIISDNASTDGTRTICEAYARQDRRIRYVRQVQTVPIMDNFVSVLELARGECFMWATHDDYYESDDHIAALYHRIGQGFSFVFPNSNIMLADATGHLTYYKRNVFQGLHRPRASKFEMCRDFVKVYGDYLYGMHIYGMFKTARLRKLLDYFKQYSRASIYCAEGSFLHKIFSSENTSFVENVYFNYVYHGQNESAIAPPKLLVYYLYYTYFVIGIYFSSSFSAVEKISILCEVAKIHSYKILWTFIFTLKYFYNGLLHCLGVSRSPIQA